MTDISLSADDGVLKGPSEPPAPRIIRLITDDDTRAAIRAELERVGFAPIAWER